MTKLPFYLFKYIVYGEIVDIIDEPLPIEVENDWDYGKICEELEKYIKNKGYEFIERTLVDCDVSEGWERSRFVFKFDGKLYAFSVVWDNYSGWEEDCPCVKEVKPVQKTITVYE